MIYWFTGQPGHGKTTSPILTDSYRKNRTTGAFILVDPSTHLTLAAGVVG